MIGHYAVPLFIRSINDTHHTLLDTIKEMVKLYVRPMHPFVYYSLHYFILILLSKYNV